MDKLSQKSEWQTLPASAKFLSAAFDEEITETDVLRFALENGLQLSVNFVNYAHVKYGKIVRFTPTEVNAAIDANALPPGLEWGATSAEITATFPNTPAGKEREATWYVKNTWIGDDQWLSFTDAKVEEINGVWNLPLIAEQKQPLKNDITDKLEDRS